MECCNFFKMTFLKRIFFLAQPLTFLCSIGISASHLTAIFDATKLPHMLVLPIGL